MDTDEILRRCGSYQSLFGASDHEMALAMSRQHKEPMMKPAYYPRGQRSAKCFQGEIDRLKEQNKALVEACRKAATLTHLPATATREDLLSHLLAVDQIARTAIAKAQG